LNAESLSGWLIVLIVLWKGFLNGFNGVIQRYQGCSILRLSEIRLFPDAGYNISKERSMSLAATSFSLEYQGKIIANLVS
jgi:hypothetical protein